MDVPICQNCQACVRISFPLPGGSQGDGTPEARPREPLVLVRLNRIHIDRVIEQVYICTIIICN